MANSRAKGNKNERMGAGLLTKWTKRKFQRTPSSGGLQWKTAFSKGDVVCCKEGHFFPFCVEIKAHKEIDFSHLLNPKVKNVKVLEFWEQCKRDAAACNKVPMLMMRYNNMPKDFFFLALPYNFYHQLRGNQLLNITQSLLFWDRKTNEKIVIIPSNQFFTLSYKEVKLLAKSYLKNG